MADFVKSLRALVYSTLPGYIELKPVENLLEAGLKFNEETKTWSQGSSVGIHIGEYSRCSTKPGNILMIYNFEDIRQEKSAMEVYCNIPERFLN